MKKKTTSGKMEDFCQIIVILKNVAVEIAIKLGKHPHKFYFVRRYTLLYLHGLNEGITKQTNTAQKYYTGKHGVNIIFRFPEK